jgi:protein-S-isoprenylcysteine O-methyltransferase Ste14
MEAATDSSPWRAFRIAATNLSLALLFSAFAYANAMSFSAQPRLSVFLLLVTETLVAVFFLIRRDPDQTRHTWMSWITTTGGTLTPLLLRPTDATADVPVGEWIQTAGFVLQILAVLSLNRSFGLLPAHRRVKTDGLYRFVRHPLYAAYALVFVGYLINNPSLANLAVVVVGTAFQVLRIREEESLLRTVPEWGAFAERVRWRLIPPIW